MKNYFIKKSSLRGEIITPSSKSQTMRAILFASLAKGQSKIKNFLKSDDVYAFIEGCKKFKAQINLKKNYLEITGINSKIAFKKNEKLDVKNSGIALRFLTSIYALGDRKIEITGDASICSNRSMIPLIESLNFLGADVKSKKLSGFAPLEVQGPFKAGKVKINGVDSQHISSLLIAMSLLKDNSVIEVLNPGEKPWVNLTLSWLDRFGVKYENNNFEIFKIFTPNKFRAFEYETPSDFSSILFPIVAALITKSEITITNIIFDDLQNDQKTIEIFKRFGANIEINRDKKKIIVKKSNLKGNEIIDVNDFVDSVPILAVLGCFNDGKIVLKNAKVSRTKESDRLFAIANELKKLKANIQESEDGLIIEKSNLSSAIVCSHKDHRIAMSLAVAALAIDGATQVKDINCISKTYPTFKGDFKKLGATIL